MKFNPDINYFAKTNFRNQSREFGIKTDDRRRHTYVIGKTGMGKSEILKNMAIQDIKNGKGVAFIDPHGDSVEELLSAVPPERINDVVYFNPADVDYPIAFNILESVDDPHQKNLVASGLIGIFKKLWADSWGPRLEYLLRNAILALLDFPGATLLGVTRILVDKEYRKKVIDKTRDPVVKSFWTQEYPKYNQQFQVEAASPIQNKVGQFLSLSLIRNIIGQVKSAIDIRDIMDNKKILFLNLSKGRIGEDSSALLGAMMITKIQMAAMGRVDIPEDDREDFYLYVDEFQNFVTNSFADILSEARKYKLNLIIAHQYIAQLTTADSTRVRDAVFGNVGTLVTFRVGADDAEFLAKEFTPTFDETDLVNLTKYDVYLKLMIDGVASSPFSATTLYPFETNEGNEDKIIKVSRERYGQKREIIEDKIARWAGFHQENGELVKQDDSVDTDVKPAKKRPTFIKTEAKDDSGIMAKCSNCNKDIKVKFKPDGVRPVFCPDCLSLYKQKKLDTSKFKVKGQIKNKQPIIKVPEIEEAPKKKVVVEEVIPPTPAEISLSEALSSVTNKNVSNKKGEPVEEEKLVKVIVPEVAEKSAEQKTILTAKTQPEEKIADKSEDKFQNKVQTQDKDDDEDGPLVHPGEIIKF